LQGHPRRKAFDVLVALANRHAAAAGRPPLSVARAQRLLAAIFAVPAVRDGPEALVLYRPWQDEEVAALVKAVECHVDAHVRIPCTLIGARCVAIALRQALLPCELCRAAR
jgi:hypothetical protein